MDDDILESDEVDSVMNANKAIRVAAVAVLAPTVIGTGAVLGASGIAAAQAPPGILEFEYEQEDGRPIVEVEFVDLQGRHREIEVDLQTGRIIEDELEDEGAAPALIG
ncbi:MAG: PepSY domain-containing protein [Nocardiaceae bacterium]|nr:PepSY domain-containing protein [Nocardiaceae bacterium]